MWGIVVVTTAGHCGLSAECGWKLSCSAESASDRERLVESARILAAVAIKQHQFNSNESISLLTTKRVAVLSRMVRFGVKYRSLKTNKILEKRCPRKGSFSKRKNFRLTPWRMTFSSPLSPYLYRDHPYVRSQDSRIIGSNFVQVSFFSYNFIERKRTTCDAFYRVVH